MHHETISRLARAEQYRRDALECQRAGFRDFATINHEMAEFLDPSPIQRGARRGAR